jgi:hypothetical protein
MGKRKREQGVRCTQMPGEVFLSRTDADEMRVTRQINAATGGMGKADYTVKLCGCDRHHLMTTEHFARWDARRREKQREKRRNA